MSKVVLKGLSKSFGDVNVVNNIDLEINDHEFLSFLGPSGCGKTTTLRMIAGFDMPTTGEIFIGERLVSSVGKKIFVPPEERNVGMVFQNYAVWPHMDVFKNVAYPLKIKKTGADEMKERVMKVLSMVKLTGMEKRYPHQLSGGQQQRVALARALVMEPDVMLLDEPLSNLDAKLREEMRFEIKDIQRRIGVTIIYVTHDQAEAMAMSDRILLLHNARVQQLGTPRDLYERPENQFVADFIGLINFLKIDVVDRDGRTTASFTASPETPPFEVNLENTGKSNEGGFVFAVRPENVKLVSPDSSSIRGKVTKKVYLGNILDYRVALGKEEIRVEASSGEEFQPGQTVGLRFESYVLFK
jgi:iron(III) transport system ATP-binding protein